MQPHNSSGLQARFILSIALTFTIFLAELIGGLWTGSLALLSDSAHVFMDVFALGLSFLALMLSARPADDRHTFGYHRLEVLAALVNGVSLVIISLGIWWESIQRFQNPEPVKSGEMLVIAFIGLVVNVVVAVVLGGHEHEHQNQKGHSHRDLNVHSAFLHVVGDAVSSVGVIVAAIVISATGWFWVDPLMSVLIGGLIAAGAYRVTRSSLHILIEGVPEGLSSTQVGAAILEIPGISDIHDLHIWNICSGHVALSAHVILPEDQSPEQAMAAIKQRLVSQFGIEHSTIQLEHTPCQLPGSGCGSIVQPVPQIEQI